MLWWHWLVLGLVLVALEMAASGGFYVIFFGIAALVVGALHLFGLAGSGLAAVAAVLGRCRSRRCLFFRSPLMRWLQLDTPGRDVDSLVGETAAAARRHRARRSRPRGAARHGLVGAQRRRHRPHRGQRCTVVRVDRLMIFLEPEGARA